MDDEQVLQPVSTVLFLLLLPPLILYFYPLSLLPICTFYIRFHLSIPLMLLCIKVAHTLDISSHSFIIIIKTTTHNEEGWSQIVRKKGNINKKKDKKEVDEQEAEEEEVAKEPKQQRQKVRARKDFASHWQMVTWTIKKLIGWKTFFLFVVFFILIFFFGCCCAGSLIFFTWRCHPCP